MASQGRPDETDRTAFPILGTVRAACADYISVAIRSVLGQEQDVQVIQLTAKKYEYSPSPVHVEAGTKVRLKITAVDHDHDFKIGTVPDGAGSSEKSGLVFASLQDC